MAGIPQIKVIFDRRKKASAANPGTVEIEVSYNRERVRLSTGVAVLKQQWSGREVVNHPQADHLNEQIRRVYDGLHEKMSTIASKKGEYDLSLLKKVKKTKVQGSSASFLDWLEERIYMRPVTESTRRQHLVMLNCLREFGLIRFFCDLTPKNIRLWDDFIRKRVTAQSSVHGYHKRLKPYIIEAIQFEKLEANPYDGMRIPRGKSEGIKFLTEEERDRVEALELYGMTEKVRDMFIFSCYTGLAYSDLVKIKKSDVFMQGDDYCIRDKRLKTGMPYTIVLLPISLDNVNSLPHRLQYGKMTRKITISDGVFYRLWRMVPAGGFPDRCFVIMAVIQSAWIMLPILAIGNLPLCRIFPAISPYYPDIILWPILPLYIALLVYGSRRYNENHYIRLHKTVTDLPLHKWRSLRRRSTTAIWLSTAAVIADILLAIRLYHI